MTQQGFEDYIFGIYGHVNGTANSYITGIHIIDEMLSYNNVFGLNGQSLTCINDTGLLCRIADFVFEQQLLYKKGKDSIFRNINPRQTSYPGKGFCSAAISQLLDYNYSEKEKDAETIVARVTNASKIAKDLRMFFDLDREGTYIEVKARERVGQKYFRKMVLTNYGSKCCVTGLDVPQTLRASHIVAWAENKQHRMDPENGLCLSATYDAAFDMHLISFDDNYRMIVSKEIKDYYTNEVTKEYFNKFEGKQLILPVRFMPSKRLLERHRELLVG